MDTKPQKQPPKPPKDVATATYEGDDRCELCGKKIDPIKGCTEPGCRNYYGYKPWT